MAKTARLTAVAARRSDRAARTSSGVPTSASNAELTGRLRRDEQAPSNWVADMGGDIDRRRQRDYRFGGRGTAGERAGLSNSLADAGRQVDRRRDSEAEHLLRAGEIAARYGEGGVLATDAAGLRRSALADLDAERKAAAAWLPRAARTIAHTAAAGRMGQAGQIAGLVGTLHKDLGALVQSGDMEAAELNRNTRLGGGVHQRVLGQRPALWRSGESVWWHGHADGAPRRAASPNARPNRRRTGR